MKSSEFIESEFDVIKARESLYLNGFTLVPLFQPEIMDQLKYILNSNLNKTTNYYCNLKREDWHRKILSVQSIFNQKSLLYKLINSQKNILNKIFDAEKLGWVDVLKLRAVRPITKTDTPDHVPFHRETLYAKSTQVRFQYNYWTPVSSSATSSGIRYIPKSHMVLDESLKIEADETHYAAVERYSAGHSIGYPYLPKVIKNINSFSKEKEKIIKVPNGYSLLFSAMLIHGNGINQTNSIRYSVDTGFIPAQYLKDNKPLFAANNKPHYKLI